MDGEDAPRAITLEIQRRSGGESEIRGALIDGADHARIRTRAGERPFVSDRSHLTRISS
jgi:hypothetical protein